MKKFFAWFLTLTTLFTQNSSFVSLVHAQEATESAIVEVLPSPTPEPTPEPTVIPSPTPAVAISDWQQIDENTDKTLLTVAEGKEYSFRDAKVKVKFTKVTTPGYLTIKQIKLSTDEQTKLGALSDTAYDITSDMVDGSFTYDLTLPNPKPNEIVAVKYSEDGTSYQDINEETKNDVVEIKGLDHFTIFVVTNAAPPPNNLLQNIVDNSDSGFQVLSGTWRTSTSIAGYYGSNYITTDNRLGTEQVRWNFTATHTGSSQVFSRWTASANRGTTVPFTIAHDGGSTTVTVNQESNNGTWVSLGTYAFTQGNSYSVTLTNNATNANDYVIGDAIKWENVSDPTLVYVDNAWSSLASGTVVTDYEGGTRYMGFDAFATIPNAVSGVASGGEIKINDSATNYSDPVSVDKPLTLTCKSNSGTTINTGNTNIGISLIGGADNVTIKDCKLTGNGDGINADSVSNLTLQNLIIDNNAFATSGAYLSNVTTANISGTTFSNNIVGLDLVGTTTSVTVSTSTFTNNSGYDVSNNTSNDAMAVGNTWDRVSGYYSPKVLESTGLVIYDNSVAVPTGITPVDGTYITTANLTSISWNAVTDDYGPVTYVYQSAYDSGFTSLAYTSGDLATNSIPTGGTPEGVYYVHVKAKDALNNISAWSTPVKITVDNTAPIITIDPYTTSWTNLDVVVTASTNEGTLNTNSHTFTTNGSFDFVATDAAGNSSTTTVTITNIDKTEPVLTSKTVFLTSWYNTDQTSTFSYADGESGIASGNPASCVISTEGTGQTCTVTPNVCDVAGNCNTTPITSNSIDLDKTNPGNPGIPAPDVLSPTTSTTINWNWSAADGAIAGIKWYRWDLWNSLASVLTGTTTGLTATTSGLLDEMYSLRVTAEDNAGNVSGEASSSGVIVDTTNPNAPTFVSSSHTLSTWSSDRSIDISWTATDPTPGSGIAGYSYIWNNAANFTPDTTSEGTATSTTSPNRPTGQSTYFHVRAVDGLGHWGPALNYGPFWIDANNPTGSWVSPLNNAYLRGTVNLEVSASDIGSGVKDVVFRIKPSGGSFTTISTDTTSPYQATLNTTTKSDGAYVLRARITDVSGRAVTRDINVTIDNTPPILTSAETQDRDHNGQIDAMVLTFNENIKDSYLTTGADGWDVAGYTGESISTGTTANDNKLLLTFTESGTPDTAATPDVSYISPASSTHDLAGNELQNVTKTSLDLAEPAVIGAKTQDTDANGQLDAIKITLSEPINTSLLINEADHWTVSDGYIISSVDGELILHLNEKTSNDTGALPTISYSQTGSGTSVHDLASASNELVDGTWSTTDLAAPKVVWTNPSANTTISGTGVLEVSAVDEDVTKIKSVEYLYKFEGAPDTFHSLVVDTTAPYSYPWDTTSLQLGKYTVKAKVIDNADNVTEVSNTLYVAAVITNFTHFTVDTNRIQIDWTTDRPTDGRVVYDTHSHSRIDVNDFPNYGYAFSTGTLDYGTTHSMIIAGLSDNTYYYFRAISAGTPIVISNQGWNKTFTVTGAGGGGGGGGGGGTPTSNTPPATPPAPAAIQGQVAGAATEEPVVEELLPTPTPIPSPTPVVEGTSTELPSFNWWLVIVPSFLFLFLLLLWLARRLRS